MELKKGFPAPSRSDIVLGCEAQRTSGSLNYLRMAIILLFLSVCFVAYSNGANDNFKGVASLFGSRTCGYRRAISWATITTFAGSMAAIFFAQALLKQFSGKGLVPEELTTSPNFILAVALSGGLTVILATLLGFPVSTTHSLIGALVGAGWIAARAGVRFEALGKVFVLPLLVSPVLAVATGAVLYPGIRLLCTQRGITREQCICAGLEHEVPVAGQVGTLSALAVPKVTVTVDTPRACAHRYVGMVFGVGAGRMLDALHFLSAGLVSFARGLNDTPKIAALLLVSSAFGVQGALIAVAAAMAVGGLLNARKVADTMSHKLTDMNSIQGLAANLSTALLVTTASVHGLPVSTTHVSVGSLLGMGAVTGQTKWRPVIGVMASWVVTLPCAAVLGAGAYSLVRLF